MMRSLLTTAYGDPRQATRTVAYAAYVLFRVFDDDGAHPATGSHPSPSTRMGWVGNTIYSIFAERPAYGYAPDDFAQDLGEIMKHAEVDCGMIQGRAPDIRGLQSAYGKDGLEYLDTLSQAWAAIRPSLEQYKRGGKLPP